MANIYQGWLMIRVSFSLFLSLSVVCYFTLLLMFTKNVLLLLFFFHENYFYFFMFRDVTECSGMFRNVPECSMFRVLSTPLLGLCRLKSLSKYLIKENLLYAQVTEALQLIDIDRVKDNLEQQKLLRLNHTKRSCLSFPYKVHQVVFLIHFSKGSKPQGCLKHGPSKRIHQRTAELLQNLLCNH